ncbi:hypothetical protein [Nocardia sp. NBC_01377]|uniref:hypothetical protein n=1 Tax=Nocardia sp. NBC_01377 TaxID=2903595 RepID=UPI00386F610A
MPKKNRLNTMRVLASAHPALRGSLLLNDIIHELNRIAAAERSDKTDSWLLKVLHTTRALDTSLKEVLAHKGWTPTDKKTGKPKFGLGAYLIELQIHGVLTPRQRDNFQKAIVDKRNRYMHQAGTMPNRLEANTILNEMDTCLSVIFTNT